MFRTLSLVSSLLFLLACSGKTNPPAAADNTTPAATTTSAPASTPAPTSTTASAPTTATSTAAAPKAVEQKQGEEYWGVYLAAGKDQKAPEMQEATKTLEGLGLKLGITFGVGALNCDVGAAEALKMADDTLAVATYFATEADAKAFAATLTKPALATAKIKAMCRD